ncbi:CDGSH iron-sulfur domain-containing protein [Mycolicibacter heraklionensis]|uniref:CDGSH iron-sulfur domain-containing protein n=1 Tax=Mycolicibacter heraklionensis TaxID=512402 RepID=A0A9X7WEI6_9MYCO|nr:CDGSH iron-sulfur domain-containing protein [Mycolicibacter heraklionensis]QZA06748.1 CDGSH iron-sulfur domain-containing protein [Mycolicibacter heraklionensis]
MTGRQPTVVQPVRNGPVLIAGPVRIETPEGVVESDRFMVAVCACGRSRNYPLCDTSHRCATRRSRSRPREAAR